MRRLCLPVIALALAGCGPTVHSAAPSSAQVTAALAGSPPALVALHRQASQLLDAHAAQVKARLAGLRGQPVVINKWASWCSPCRGEFPIFQRVSVDWGRRVAFVGLDAGDNRGDAQRFLRRYPLSYPSYFDPNERIAYALNAPAFYPTTLFYDAAGRQTYIHQGGYATPAALLDDLHRYLHV